MKIFELQKHNICSTLLRKVRRPTEAFNFTSPLFLYKNIISTFNIVEILQNDFSLLVCLKIKFSSQTINTYETASYKYGRLELEETSLFQGFCFSVFLTTELKGIRKAIRKNGKEGQEIHNLTNKRLDILKQNHILRLNTDVTAWSSRTSALWILYDYSNTQLPSFYILFSKCLKHFCMYAVTLGILWCSFMSKLKITLADGDIPVFIANCFC